MEKKMKAWALGTNFGNGATEEAEEEGERKKEGGGCYQGGGTGQLGGWVKSLVKSINYFLDWLIQEMN